MQPDRKKKSQKASFSSKCHKRDFPDSNELVFRPGIVLIAHFDNTAANELLRRRYLFVKVITIKFSHFNGEANVLM